MVRQIKRKTIYLPERENRLLVEEAIRRRVSQSEVIRELVDRALGRPHGDDPMLRFIASVSYPTKGARYVDDIYRA